MKTMTLKIDDKLVRTAMQKGGFKRPEDAVSRGLEKIIEMSPEESVLTVDEEFVRSLSPAVQKLMKYRFDTHGKTDDELLLDALEEKFLR
jgi:hypothetical protein